MSPDIDTFSDADIRRKMSSVINIEEYQNVPAWALNMSIRNFLSHMLDREEVSVTPRHLLMNWMGLAELLGYSYDAIMNFDSNGSRGKTRMLLGDYTMKGGDVATLLLSLQELERYDILEDAGFRESLRKCHKCLHLLVSNGVCI